MTYIFISFIALLVYTIWVVYNLFKAKKMPQDTVLSFTGGLGTGKTYIAVERALRAYKINLLMWRLGLMKETIYKPHPKKKKYKSIKQQVPMPMFYSNIPVKIKYPFYIRTKEKYQFSTMLTYEHILLMERIKEYSVILIDEIGQMADQYQHTNPFVMQNLQRFIRFYRHFIDGRLFVTDQSSSNIVVAIRRRLNVIYNLSEFRRFALWFYKVNVDTVTITEDMLTVKPTDIEFQEYFMGYIPFKWFKKIDFTRLFTYKKYESRVYKPLYDHVSHNSTQNLFTEYFTKYLIDVPNNEMLQKLYKKQGFVSNDQLLEFIKSYSASYDKVTYTKS